MNTSMKPIAAGLASLGRNQDSMLVHMTPGEVAGLQTLAMKHGGSLTINPHTGLPEAGFLSSILPMVAGIGLTAMTGMPAWGAGLLTGGITALTSGSLQKGILAGLGAYGGAGLGGALSNAGLNAFQQEALAQAQQEASAKAIQEANAEIMRPDGIGVGQIPVTSPQTYIDIPNAPTMTNYPSELVKMEQMAALKDAQMAQLSPAQIAEVRANAATQFKAMDPMDRISKSWEAMKTGGVDFSRDIIGQSAIKAGKDAREATGLGGWGGAALTTGAALAPVGMDYLSQMQKEQAEKQRALMQQATGQTAPNYYATSFGPGAYNPQTGLFEGRGFGPGYSTRTFPYAQGGQIPPLDGKYPQSDFMRSTYATSPQTPMGSEVVSGYAPKIDPFTGQVMLASGGLAALAEAVPTLPKTEDVEARLYAAPAYAGSDGLGRLSQAIRSGAVNEPPEFVLPYTYADDEGFGMLNPAVQRKFSAARGGAVPSYEYAAGGRLLDGPGDGMSDSIPAVIKGNKPQRAALADGEFVLPADIVSHLGNGSTKAGAKKLYNMMDKVRMARTGTKQQGKQINPDKFVPA